MVQAPVLLKGLQKIPEKGHVNHFSFGEKDT
jgi:hypothetical protein